LFLVGLIVPYNNDELLNSSGGNTKASPFVIAMSLAGIKALPSIFNVCITVAVLSVANSCAYGSTRTIQALAARGMAPKFLAYVDKKGRPIPCIILQLAFGLLAFINESGDSSTIFDWLLALSGLAYFFIWGSICYSHIRFRKGWAAQGHSLDELPYKAAFGVWGSYIGVGLNILCLIASFYVAVWPIGPKPTPSVAAYNFFESYITLPIILALFFGWKIKTGDWKFVVRAKDMDLMTGLRSLDLDTEEEHEKKPRTWKDIPMAAYHFFF